MSLILEALKKSEAKRRLGETPDLGTPFTAPRRPRIVLPVVIVLIAAALVWWGFFSGSTMQPAGRSADNQATRQSVPGQGQNAGKPPRAVARDNVTNAAPPPANLSKPEAPAGEPNFVAVGPMPNDARPRPREGVSDRPHRDPPTNLGGGPPRSSRPAVTPTASPQQAAASVAPAKAGQNSTAVSAVPPASNTAPAIATAVTPKASPSTPNATTGAPPVTTAASAANAAPASAPPSVATAPKDADASSSAPARAPKGPGTIGAPSSAAPVNTPAAPAQSAQPYSELAFSVRKSLPELRLSMHVYTADPAQRFVILNDSRLGEGEKTTDEVFVREVRPDGVVLEFQNQRFFYPRDGL